MSVKLYLGDCLDILPTLEAGSVDAVVTDPPYGVDIAAWDSDIPPQAALDECLRVSRGPVVWFGGAKTVLEFARYQPRPDRMLIWHVTFSLKSAAQNGIYYKWHPIWCWRLPKTQGEIRRDLLKDMFENASANNDGYNHPGKKPLKLMKQLVGAFGGGLVLDPFMGSGTTGVACVQTGRSFIGIEISEQYFRIAERRIKQAQAQLPLPLD